MNILSLAPLAGPGVDMLRSLGELTIDPWNEHAPPRFHSAADLVARLAGTDALIVEADHVSSEVLERASLRLLGVCRGDPVNVDLPAATKHGVVVIRAPGRNADAVAELTLGFFYALLRSIRAADADVRAGRWIVGDALPQNRFAGRELQSCTVGLVGCGAVGRAVAQRLVALGVRTLACDPAVPDDVIRAIGVGPVAEVGDLVAGSDIVSVHAPLSAQTRGLIGEAELARLRPGSYLVNTARYGIVAEEPLLAALGDGRLAGAAFDHFEGEFLAPDHPLIAMPHVILTPHIGGSTLETIENHTLQIAQGFVDVLDGRVPASVVNPEVLPLR